MGVDIKDLKVTLHIFVISEYQNYCGLLGARKKTRMKRKQEEQVNRTYIQNKSVSTAGRSVHQKLSGLFAGRKFPQE